MVYKSVLQELKGEICVFYLFISVTTTHKAVVFLLKICLTDKASGWENLESVQNAVSSRYFNVREYVILMSPMNNCSNMYLWWSCPVSLYVCKVTIVTVCYNPGVSHFVNQEHRLCWHACFNVIFFTHLSGGVGTSFAYLFSGSGYYHY